MVITMCATPSLSHLNNRLDLVVIPIFTSTSTSISSTFTSGMWSQTTKLTPRTLPSSRLLSEVGRPTSTVLNKPIGVSILAIIGGDASGKAESVVLEAPRAPAPANIVMMLSRAIIITDVSGRVVSVVLDPMAMVPPRKTGVFIIQAKQDATRSPNASGAVVSAGLGVSMRMKSKLFNFLTQS